jgi:hypothetical protein
MLPALGWVERKPGRLRHSSLGYDGWKGRTSRHVGEKCGLESGNSAPSIAILEVLQEGDNLLRLTPTRLPGKMPVLLRNLREVG